MLRFEVSAETLATFREAAARLRRGCDFKLDDDAVLPTMARHLLGGPTDEGRASYQISMSVCPHCDGAAQQACGELVDVSPEVAEMVKCDAQQIGEVKDAHGGVAKRATQNVPPAVRRLVMRRDNRRCVVPGCKHTQFVDVHHLNPRAEGGDHDPDTLVVLCCAHHRATHTGTLIIEGRVSTGLKFLHADGSTYGQLESPKNQALYTKLFTALRGMGFGERETRQALEQVRERLPQETDASKLLREAFAALVPDPNQQR